MKSMTVRTATEEDALSIAGRLRQADLKEIHAAGRDPESCLVEGVKEGDRCLVAVDEDDEPQIIFGTAPSPHPMLGFVWMMATPAIRDCWIQLLKETPRWTDELAHGYEVLGNLVHAENLLHIRWLKWAGFVFLRKVEFNGHGFYEFARMTKSGEQNV